MKHLKVSTVLAIAGCLFVALTGEAQTQPAKVLYSLKTVEANPIPMEEHFLLWREIALKQCNEARSRYNLSSEECLQVVGQRADACASKLAAAVPPLITTTVVARDVGRKGNPPEFHRSEK